MTVKRNFRADFDADWLRRKVRIFCAENDLRQLEFAKMAELHESALTTILRGRRMPSQKLLSLLGYEWRIVPIEVKKGDK